MVTVEELKEMIVDLRMDLVRVNIPSGNCPYAYYNIKNPFPDCNTVTCEKCKQVFFKNIEKEIIREVETL